MIIVCEPTCKGLTHVPFNSAFLEIIRCANPSEKIIFFGEKYHLQEIKNQMNETMKSSIFWKEIPIFQKPKNAIMNSYSHLKFIKKYFIKTDLIVFTSANSSILISLKILLVFRKIKCQVVLHSNLNQIRGWRSMNPLVRMMDFKSALTWRVSQKKIQYIVLEKPIKCFMLKVLPCLKNSVMVLDHPIPCNMVKKKSIRLSKPIRIGFLGISSTDKGFPDFLGVANEIQRFSNGSVEFHAIGSMTREVLSFDLDALHRNPSEAKLTRAEYIDCIHSMHFICLPYDKKFYELSASGALLDAIASEIPLISSRFPGIEELEKKFGNLGYLCDSPEEILDCIKKIIQEHDENQYIKQKNTLKKISMCRKPFAIIPQYRDITEKLFHGNHAF